MSSVNSLAHLCYCRTTKCPFMPLFINKRTQSILTYHFLHMANDKCVTSLIKSTKLKMHRNLINRLTSPFNPSQYLIPPRLMQRKWSVGILMLSTPNFTLLNGQLRLVEIEKRVLLRKQNNEQPIANKRKKYDEDFIEKNSTKLKQFNILGHF